MSSAKSGRKDLGISCRATSILVWSAVTLSSEISEPALVLVPLKYTFQFVGLRGVPIFMSVEDIAGVRPDHCRPGIPSAPLGTTCEKSADC